MGRRSTHTPDELRELILEAARSIIERDGLAGLSARTIAKRIGYSPGTLYNVFENLADILLHVEARVLEDLDQKVIQAISDAPQSERLKRLTHCYLRFTQDRPRLWNLLSEHHVPSNYKVPAWYQSKIDSLLAHVSAALTVHMPDAPKAAVEQSARVLWAGVHGIASLATANKSSTITSDGAAVLIEDLTSGYLRGIRGNR